MNTQQTVKLVAARLRNLGHTKAAALLDDEYILTHLNLPAYSGTQKVRLPSGRKVGFRTAGDLSSLAKMVESIDRQRLAEKTQELIHVLTEAGDRLMDQCQGYRWLPRTMPYRYFEGLRKTASQPATREKLLAKWEAYCESHPDNATEKTWAALWLHRRGLKPATFQALAELQELDPAGLLLEVLKVIHGPAPMAAYETAPVCRLLQLARVIPTVDKLKIASEFRLRLFEVMAWLARDSAELRQGFAPLVELVSAEGAVPGVAPGTLLKTLRRMGSDHRLPELCRAARDPGTTHTAALPVPPVSPQVDAEVTPRGLSSTLNRLLETDAGLPDEVMRSLLEAALTQAARRRRYGLPEGEYWVICPDPILRRAGVERFTFEMGSGPARVYCVTAPLHLRFPLTAPPEGTTGGALLTVLMAAVMYEAMVTGRESFATQRSGQRTSFSWSRSTAGPAKQRTKVSRVLRSASASKRGSSRHVTRVAVHAASYVVPHLRKLRPGGHPSDDAISNAAAHGIRLPRGYTFVRGHMRGAGAPGAVREFTIAEIALETIDRLRRRAV